MSTLLELIDIFGISVQDFFYLGKDYNEKDKEVLELYANLTNENKHLVIDLMKNLQK